ncbi:Hypothetical predicted protein [Mytilus galloprovincialis]|nr:Hypothetical predicted protein [Mytilus galloprovincialis]
MDEATLFVAAIDIGTTYSGYAFSTKSQPENIYTCDWKNTTLISNKAPTSLLLNNRKQFLAFGYDAEAKYTESLENDSDDEEEKDKLLFFRRFKMILHNKSVDMDTMIEDESGFEMKAIEVFTIAIQYLKEQIIMKLKQTLKAVDGSDIHFVLTVPGIWEDRAKFFMRKAAEKASIRDKIKTSSHSNPTEFWREIDELGPQKHRPDIDSVRMEDGSFSTDKKTILKILKSEYYKLFKLENTLDNDTFIDNLSELSAKLIA